MEGLSGHENMVRCDLERAVQECHVLILPMQGCDAQGKVQSSYAATTVDLSTAGKRPGLLVLTGVAGERLRSIALANQWRLLEIADDDELAILNSVPTAEGAVRLAQERAVVTIHASKCLVVGLGRCGLTLALLLKNMGAHVAVVARKRSDLARAASLGLSPVSLTGMIDYLPQVDFVFNTVPKRVLDRAQLKATAEHVVVIDIASAPGGVDYSAAQAMNRTAVLAPGIPGKFTPHTAGQILGRVLPRLIIENLPEER